MRTHVHILFIYNFQKLNSDNILLTFLYHILISSDTTKKQT